MEIDEVYITAGCKGNNGTRPATREPRCRGLKKRGRGTYDSDKVPILGIVQRQGSVHFSVLKNVKTKTIRPIIEELLEKETTVYTDEYAIYNFLTAGDAYQHRTVCYSKGEYAIPLDEDGPCTVHVNTQEGCWSLLRPWIRPHRGVNKMYLPLYIGWAQWMIQQSKKTPATQIRKLIQMGCSQTGYEVKELYRLKQLLPLCTV